MPAQIYRYTKVIEPGPNGYTIYARIPEGGLELCELDGKTYVTVPADAELLEQHEAITLEPVIVDSGLRERLKKTSRAVLLIDQAVIDLIRSQYSLDDEQYFARIGVGAALGAYQFEPGEQESMLAFGAHVEACRQWGREQRAALGL
jgi:hypothetical protein